MIKNKLIFVILVILILLNSIFLKPAFALSFRDSNRKFTFNSEEVICPEGSSWFIYRYGSFYIYECFSKPRILNTRQSFDYIYKFIIYDDGTFKEGNSSPNGVLSYEGGVSIDHEFVASNYDIKNHDGSLVFQQPVLTLGEVLEITNPVKTFQTMTHGMIVSLIALVVGLVAFWKGWQFLFKEYRKA